MTMSDASFWAMLCFTGLAWWNYYRAANKHDGLEAAIIQQQELLAQAKELNAKMVEVVNELNREVSTMILESMLIPVGCTIFTCHATPDKIFGIIGDENGTVDYECSPEEFKNTLDKTVQLWISSKNEPE